MFHASHRVEAAIVAVSSVMRRLGDMAMMPMSMMMRMVRRQPSL